MRADWETKKLGEIYSFKNGINFGKAQKNGKGILTLDVYNMYCEGLEVNTTNLYRIDKQVSEDYKLKNGDILIVRSSVKEHGVAWATYFAEGNEPITFCGFIIRGRPINDINAGYVVYYLRTHEVRNELIRKAVKSTITNINQATLSEVKIPLPSLEEQAHIVSILDKAFVAIHKTKENIEKNLQNAREIFESYLHNVFENKGKDWEENKLSEICTLINGRAYNKQELLQKGKYTVLRVGNFFTNNHWYYSDLELPEDKYCSKGDLLYAWSASFGPRIWEGEKVIYHYHIWKVIPNTNLVTKDFLYILFDWDKDKIKAAQGTGTTMMHVSKGSMEERIVPLPPISEQIIIVQKLNFLLEEIKRLETIYQQKLFNLEELKKTILQKAFAGALTSTIKVTEVPVEVPNISTTDLQAGITIISFQKHKEKGRENTFHHVKAEKIINMAEYHLNINLNRNPVKDAAGPNDFSQAKKVESRAAKAGFYTVSKNDTFYSYTLGQQSNKIAEKAKASLGEKLSELNNLIDLMVPLNTQQAEVVATVYAAWNNLLIEDCEITDEAIVTEARENWHPDKLNIERQKFFDTITWLRKKELVPQGNGKKILPKQMKA